MRNKEKENVGPNYIRSSHFGESQLPISPVKKNEIGESFITNVFEDYAKSNQEIGLPLPHGQHRGSSGHAQSQQYIRDPEGQCSEVGGSMYWKGKYEKLAGTYESLNRKCESRTKEMHRMQETIDGQASQIRQLEEDNAELNRRINGLLAQSQRSSPWGWGSGKEGG